MATKLQVLIFFKYFILGNLSIQFEQFSFIYFYKGSFSLLFSCLYIHLISFRLSHMNKNYISSSEDQIILSEEDEIEEEPKHKQRPKLNSKPQEPEKQKYKQTQKEKQYGKSPQPSCTNPLSSQKQQQTKQSKDKREQAKKVKEVRIKQQKQEGKTANPTQDLQDFHSISDKLYKNYELMKKQDQNNSAYSSFASSSQQTNKILLYLKEIHMQEQSTIVKGIKQISVESKKIIEDLTTIQADIDKYHNHIEEWIKKIQDMQSSISKIKAVESSFKQKAQNMSKLKDFLNVDRPKRR